MIQSSPVIGTSCRRDPGRVIAALRLPSPQPRNGRPPPVSPRRSAAAAPSGPATQPRAAAGSRRCWPSPPIAFAVGIVIGSRHEPSERRAGHALRLRVGARRLRHDALAADRAGARRVSAAPLQPRLRPRGGHRDALAGARRRRRGSATAARSTSDVTFATRIFGTHLRPARARGRGRRRRHAGHRLAPGAGLPRPAGGRAARARDDDAAARGDRGARRHGHRPRRGAPVRRSGRWPPRSPAGSARRRPSARRSWRAAASPRARRSASTGLERTFDERLAGTPGRHAEGGRPRARPQRAGGRVRGPDARSTRRSRRRRSPRWPAASAGSR